jgi:EAL domain-containing protein (putative c-di-GMP-specific phosphodiesterase class I)
MAIKKFVAAFMSVNLSARQLMHPSLVGHVRSALTQAHLSPKQLKLEVTESTVMEHSDRSMSVLMELATLGVSLSTDDFRNRLFELELFKPLSVRPAEDRPLVHCGKSATATKAPQ